MLWASLCGPPATMKDLTPLSFRPQCTRNALARSVQRHRSQAVIDEVVKTLGSRTAKADLATRKHLMERSFARATRYSFDRARWRGLGKVTIQEYLVSAIQNIKTLIRYGRKPTKGARNAPLTARGRAVWAYIRAWLAFLARRRPSACPTALA